MTARDIFEIVRDLADKHDHKIKDFRACPFESCKALARIAGPGKNTEEQQ